MEFGHMDSSVEDATKINAQTSEMKNESMMGEEIPMVERPPILFKSTKELRSMNLSREDIAEARRRAAEDCSSDYQSYLHPMLDNPNRSIMWTAHNIMKMKKEYEKKKNIQDDN